VFNTKNFLAQVKAGKTMVSCGKNHSFFSQGDEADSVFYILLGKVKLSVVYQQGKEVIVAVLEATSFFGESCLTGQVARLESATAMGVGKVWRIGKSAMVRLLREDPAFSSQFLEYLLARNLRIQADLVDQLFNSAEKRLARILLLKAHFGKENNPDLVIPHLLPETLAEMIGTTPARVKTFLKKFRKLGFIDDRNGMHVHTSLLNVVLHD